MREERKQERQHQGEIRAALLNVRGELEHNRVLLFDARARGKYWEAYTQTLMSDRWDSCRELLSREPGLEMACAHVENAHIEARRISHLALSRGVGRTVFAADQLDRAVAVTTTALESVEGQIEVLPRA
jgi:hypothetical protein